MIDMGIEPIFQVAFVVPDIDEAVERWARVHGAGPFGIMRNVRYEHFEYRGRSGDIEMSLAFGYSGDMQIELMQQHCRTPSLYLTAAGDPVPGVHHFGVLTDDLERDSTRLKGKGLTLEQSSYAASTGAEVRFFSGAPCGLVELIQTPDRAVFGFLRQQAAQWDGVNPVLGTN